MTFSECLNLNRPVRPKHLKIIPKIHEIDPEFQEYLRMRKRYPLLGPLKRLITLPPATARAKAGDAVPRPIAEDLVPLQCLDPLHGMARGFSLFDKYYQLCVEIIFKSVQRYSKVSKSI